MALKIHPGIGIARVGESSEHFIGPETVDVPINQPGRYRDDEGKIRRQAAKFRLFDGTTHVVNAVGTTITWTVTLDGFTGSVSGANGQQFIMDSGKIVGELRTELDGDLLVMSCEIDDGTYDCVQGSVEASVSTGGTVTPAWVAILPPDFAPGKYPILPHHALFLDYLATKGLPIPGAMEKISFRNEIYPAIRGRTPKPPSELVGIANATDREAALSTFSTVDFLKPGKYLQSIFDHYISGKFTHDWSSAETDKTPDELDRGPLSFVDGACGAWGWEVEWLPFSGTNPIATGEKFRFDPAKGAPGEVNPHGWRSDLAECGNDPVDWVSVILRPNDEHYGYDWRLRGFMVRDDDDDLVYDDWWPELEVLTTELDFGDVERGSAVARTLDIHAKNFYEAATIAFVTPLPSRIDVLTTVTSTGTIDEYGKTIKLAVLFSCGMEAPLGPVPAASIQFKVDGKPFSIPISATIVEPKTTQLGLVLDCSLSMDDDRGDGKSKLQGLKAAFNVIVDTARTNDGIAVAPFSNDALKARPAHPLNENTGEDTGERKNVKKFVEELETVGDTSIGDGIISARKQLELKKSSFSRQAVIVITDGKENRGEWIKNVTIDARTFAIGIGTEDDVDKDKLTKLAGKEGGYLLLTGQTLAGDKKYRLDKFALQIVAGATRNEVVLDPIGSVRPGGVARIPFLVTEADFQLDVIVVSDEAPALALGLQGPDGTVRRFSELKGEPGVEIVRRGRTGMARVPVPLTMKGGETWGRGTWRLLLADRAHAPGFASIMVPGRGHSIDYAAIVNARSSIRLRAHAVHVWVPSSRFVIEATVTWAGIPFSTRTSVIAEVETPTGLHIDVPLAASSPGRYLGHFEAYVPGIYVTRVRAHGLSRHGSPFVRELTLTPSLSGDRGSIDPSHPTGAIAG